MRIFGGKLNIAQHNLFDHDAVRAQPLGDCRSRLLPDLFAAGGEYFAHRVVGHELAEGARDDRGHDFFVHRLRQIVVDMGEPSRVEPIAHRDREADPEAFLGLHSENFDLLPGFLGDDRAEDLASRVVDRDAVDERLDEVDAGIKRARTGAGNLADADARRAAGHHRNAEPGEYCEPSRSHRARRRLPANRWGSRQLRRTLRRGGQPAAMFPFAVKIIDRAGDCASKSSESGNQEHVLEEQHGFPPDVLFSLSFS